MPTPAPGLQPVLDAPQSGALPGLRVYVRDRGMHRLTYQALSAADVPLVGLAPSQFALWQGDGAVAIEITGDADGSFDPADAIIFYGEPYAGRYTTRNVYQLTWSSATPGVRMARRDAAPSLAAPPATVIRRRVRVEYNRQYYSGYRDLPPAADHLFDNTLYPNSVIPVAAATYNFDLPDVIPAGVATVRVAVHGGRSLPGHDPDQSVAIHLDGAALGVHQWDGSVSQVITKTAPAGLLRSGANALVLEAALSQLPGIDAYWVSPDWVEVVYPARAVARDDRLFAEAFVPPAQARNRVYLPLARFGPAALSAAQAAPAPPRAGAGDISVRGFAASGIRAYDVTNPAQPVALANLLQTGQAGAYAVTFAGVWDASYAFSSPDGFLAPDLEIDAGSDWASPAHRADYIAIVHRSLWDAVQPLLDYRAGEGLRVAKVDVQDIYDEFAGGLVDPEAIRAFLSYAYRNWNAGEAPPQYVLLVGDGHYDFKGDLRPGLPNLIPPYLLAVDPTIGETAADNRYASIDGAADFLPDMALGRIPARTPAEVTALVDKILAYERNAPAGDWQRRAVFVADRKNDPDGDFHALSDQAAQLLPSSFLTTTVYYGADPGLATPAGMKAALRQSFDGGALYLQWFGHAARASWGSDRLWEVSDPATLAPNTSWPLTAHFSCWSGYFINVLPASQYGNNEQSLAEAMLLAPGKGSLADFSPTGLHLGAPLAGLNQALLHAIFVERIDRVGKATDAARLAYFQSRAGPLDVLDTQVLLGDPATRLKLP